MTDQEIEEFAYKLWLEEQEDSASRSQIRRIVQATLSRAIPEGHVVVPKEPTPEMCAAGYHAYRSSLEKGGWVVAIYREMIAAAPANKEGT